jgi:phage-related minor tail protein
MDDIYSAETLERALGRLSETEKGALKVTLDWTLVLKRQADAQSDAEKKTDRQTSAAESLDRMLSDQAVTLAQLTGQWTTQDAVMQALNVSAGDLSADGLAKLSQAIENATKIDKLERLKEIVTDFESMFVNAFESLFTDGFGTFFDNVLAGFDKLLQQIAAKWLASQLTNLVMGLLIPGGGGGGGGSAPGLGVEGMYASGGSVYGGRPILVGEQGPELFVPPMGGSIVPNNQLAMAGAMGGGTTVNISMNIQTPDANSFRRSEDQIIDEVGRRIQAVVRRNG